MTARTMLNKAAPDAYKTTLALSEQAAISGQQAAALRWVAVVTNALNRIAISRHYTVKP